MRRIGLIVALVVAAAGAWAGWEWWSSFRAGAQAQAKQADGQPSTQSQAPAGAPQPAGTPAKPAPAVPVEVARARTTDLPIYLRALGNVQAFNTVTVRARIDGELVKVAFTEGQMVKAGDLLAQIDPRPYQARLDQAVAKKAGDEAQLVSARADLRRVETLAARQFATAANLETQRARVGTLDATVKQDAAAIQDARVQLSYTTVTAPIGGRTGIRQVDQGNIVRAGDQNGIVVITQIQPISVVFTAPEATLPDITEEMRGGPLAVTALSRDEKHDLGEGVLALIDNQIDTTTGTLRAKATFPNIDNRLWPGQFVNARLRLRTERGAVTVPSQALQRGPEGMLAFVINGEDKAEVRPITVGNIDAGVAVIEKGIAAGDRVVTIGQNRLQAGTKVTVREPGAAKTASSDNADGRPDGRKGATP